ncbi:unnamed protein product [Leptosia nina]|uniref:Uncharacterized protein n=1 Tax=Leptosia nina TaxID=320188 RepID=A0AAV1K3T5_9NEOP
MKVTLLLLIVGFCIVSAKYLPYESNDSNRILLRNKRSDSEESNSSVENSSNEDSDDDNSAERKLKEQELKLHEKEEKARRKALEREEKIKRKEEELKRKLEEKREREEQKQQEKKEKEERKLQEKIEKEKRKEEEHQRKLEEKRLKDERKRQEKQLQELQKEALKPESQDSFLETEEENSVELEDVWRQHIYTKYGLNFASTALEKKAALNKYIEEELGLQANSTKSERRRAILNLIQTKLQNDAAEREAIRQQVLSHVNAVTLQKLRSDLEKDIEDLNNKTDLLKNVSLPWAVPLQENIQEKKTFLQALSQFLGNILPNWIAGNPAQNKPDESQTNENSQNDGSNTISSVSANAPNTVDSINDASGSKPVLGDIGIVTEEAGSSIYNNNAGSQNSNQALDDSNGNVNNENESVNSVILGTDENNLSSASPTDTGDSSVAQGSSDSTTSEINQVASNDSILSSEENNLSSARPIDTVNNGNEDNIDINSVPADQSQNSASEVNLNKPLTSENTNTVGNDIGTPETGSGNLSEGSNDEKESGSNGVTSTSITNGIETNTLISSENGVTEVKQDGALVSLVEDSTGDKPGNADSFPQNESNLDVNNNDEPNSNPTLQGIESGSSSIDLTEGSGNNNNLSNTIADKVSSGDSVDVNTALQTEANPSPNENSLADGDSPNIVNQDNVVTDASTSSPLEENSNSVTGGSQTNQVLEESSVGSVSGTTNPSTENVVENKSNISGSNEPSLSQSNIDSANIAESVNESTPNDSNAVIINEPADSTIEGNTNLGDNAESDLLNKNESVTEGSVKEIVITDNSATTVISENPVGTEATNTEAVDLVNTGSDVEGEQNTNLESVDPISQQEEKETSNDVSNAVTDPSASNNELQSISSDAVTEPASSTGVVSDAKQSEQGVAEEESTVYESGTTESVSYTPVEVVEDFTIISEPGATVVEIVAQ